jgi:hypothetical protein
MTVDTFPPEENIPEVKRRQPRAENVPVASGAILLSDHEKTPAVSCRGFIRLLDRYYQLR